MGKFLTSRNEDYSQWYNELVTKAGLAEPSAVRGCMVIKRTCECLFPVVDTEIFFF